jgi:hypothetical protein
MGVVVSADTQARLLQLLDKQDISECLLRYTRGMDRLDRELLLSAYHPDAVDHHGDLCRSPSEFWEYYSDWHRQYNLAHHHSISNSTIELDGDSAHVETYWLFQAVNVDDSTTLHGGRYIDRFEKRQGQWKIAARACIMEWHGKLGDIVFDEATQAANSMPGVGRRDRQDRSYERPLNIQPVASAVE